MPARHRTLLAGVALLASLLPAPALASPSAPTLTATAAAAAAATPASKLRGDLAALVAGDTVLDPRIGQLVAGYRDGEIPYFVYLSEPNDAAHRAALESLGARVLRTYRSVPVFALASSPTTVLRVAAKPWVSWMAPIELVVALDEPVVDQSRATTADIGAPQQWDLGVTGTGVRIAVLDTGVDPVHQDLDDLDFGAWSGLLNGAKVVEARDFNGGGCGPIVIDGHGHGTHVAGIATGTGEGTPAADDNGRYAGIAPGAELAVGKVLTDAGAGINSDLLAAMEWAAMPDSADPLSCSVGADIVNMSIGSEARPGRLNSDSDVDMVSLVLNRLAVQYGTLFVAAAGNSGPYIGSVLEAPGSAAQALSVAATAKDWDVNHDDTLSGDTCAGWQHPPAPNEDDDCSGGIGTQPPSVSSFSSRGPSGDVWLRPDLAAPGYNIVSAQSSTGVALVQNDLSRNTRADPLYATATGTSMAAPATAGSAALLLDAYRQRYGVDPTGASGVSGMNAPAYALLRAALMNSAGGDLYEARWILTTDTTTRFDCPDPDPLFGLCAIAELFADTAIGSLRLYDERNGAGDPYIGPLAEGAGKLQIGRAIAALRDGLVVYSAASGTGATAGTGHRDLQGSWQVGAVTAGSTVTQKFILHAAPGAGTQQASFAFDPGHPSDGSRAIPTTGAGAWSVLLPGTTTVLPGGNGKVSFNLTIPAGTPSGTYTGVVRITTTAGQAIRVPVFASVALHDPDPAEGNTPGPQARITSGMDVFAKDDTIWPSVAGAAPTGTNADWLVYPVELAASLSEARFSVYDAAAGNETYDLYLYDSRLDLITSTHPFAAPGVTDVGANAQRGASTQASPQVLVIGTPAAGRHYLVVSRARIGGTTPGDFGAFVLTLDEIRALPPSPLATQLAYEGDYIWTAGQPVRLAARLTDPAGSPSGTPVAGRTVTFTVDAGVGLCGEGPCQAVTDYRGIAQVASSAITLAPGIHEVHARFTGDPYWLPSEADAFVLVVGSGGPPPPPGGSAGKVTAGGWFVPDEGPAQRVHFAFHATSPGGVAPSGELRYRDDAEGLDLKLTAYTSMLITDNEINLSGQAQDADGSTVNFFLTATDMGEPGKGNDTIRFRVPERGNYDRSGTLGGGNIQLH